jgi:DNA-directed RNA polymerase subunit beta
LPGKKKKDGRAGKKLTNLSSPYSLNGRKQITIPKENVLPWHKISVQFKKIKKNSHINKNDSFFKAWQAQSDTDANSDLLARPADLLISPAQRAGKAGRELINLYSQNNILTVLGHNKFKFFSFNKSSLTILQQKLMNKQLQRKSYILKSMPEWHALKKEQIKKQNPKEVKKSKAYAAYSLNLNNFTPKQTNVRNTPCVRTRFVHLGKTSDNLHSFKNFFGCDFRQILTQEQLIPSFKLQEIGKAMKQQKPRLLKNKIMNLTTLSDSSQIKSQNKNLLNNVSSVQVYLAEKRRIQVGDKMAGRHGNKGIISQILPIEDMPFLPDGKPLDMVLNPLGVPSRMNVGQIYECLLGLAGKHLGENFKVFPFDEIYGAEASRSFVYSKLYEARFKTGKQWLFNQNSPGKIRLYDGRTGETFDQAITVGYAYMLRLVHMVDDKIHARSTGPYSLVTQQPLRGRSKQGGQRLGEMEVWALEGYGAAFTLLEMLTIKSDDMTGRMTLWSNLILNKEISIGTPESFKVLICELQALCLDIGLFKVE